MPTMEWPRRRVAALEELSARLLEHRRPRTDNESFARLVLLGFHDVCVRWGLDGVLAALADAHPPLDLADPAALADHPTWLPALVAQLAAIDLDDGSPGNTKPRRLAERLLAALGLAVVDDPDRTIELDDGVRAEVAAAFAAVAEVELALPASRDRIIADARARVEPTDLVAFDKIAAQLDDRGMRLIKEPKVPLHSMQAAQHALYDARAAILDRLARTAFDRAQPAIARGNAAAAARLDAPITHALTPRDVASVRIRDARVPKDPPAIAHALMASLTDAAALAWRAPERVARPYAASQTFAVGELVEHPKFGRGTVVGALNNRVEIEFADAKRTLIHVPAR
jgi:hypothetical protein